MYHTHLTASNINWIAGDPPEKIKNITAKIRYRSKDTSCKINYRTNDILVEFENPQFAVAPGQSIVFYDQAICLGGGFIETRGNKNIL